MDPVIIPAIIGAIATIAAALITKNWAEKRGRRKGRCEEREVWRRRLEAAPTIYAGHLSRLIEEANKAGAKHVLAKARAIVAVRDDLRSTLEMLSALLNTEIDRLSEQLEDPTALRRSTEVVEAVRETLEVLRDKWPAKCEQIDIEVRKLLTTFGLERSVAEEDNA